MAREIDLSKPLSEDDVLYLQARYSNTYVDHCIRVAGVKGDGPDEAAQRKAAENAQAAQQKAAEEAENARLEAEREQAEAAAAEATRRQQEAAEDLIGDPADGPTFDVLNSTESEVREWAANASDEDKAAALETEQAREDRDPRKGVVNILGG